MFQLDKDSDYRDSDYRDSTAVNADGHHPLTLPRQLPFHLLVFLHQQPSHQQLSPLHVPVASHHCPILKHRNADTITIVLYLSV